MPLGFLTIGLGASHVRWSPQPGVEHPLGVLLEVEVDRELDVVAVDRLRAADLAHDVAVRVDLEHHLAPLAVERRLVGLLDPAAPDLFADVGRVVAEGLVVGRVLGGDGAHVPDDVGGQRGVGIDAR